MDRKEFEELDEIWTHLKYNFDYSNLEVTLEDDNTVQDYFGEKFINKIFVVQNTSYKDIKVNIYLDKNFNLYVNPYEDIIEEVNPYYSNVWRELTFQALDSIK